RHLADHCRSEKVSRKKSNAILFNILSRGGSTLNEPNYKRVSQTCHCEKRRTVCLKTPGETCQVASDVLVKTVHFMKSLPILQCTHHYFPSADVPGLKASLFIEGLQYEAQHALKEVLVPLHPEDRGRFARILLTASTLKTITPSLITELFFRPVIGQADLLDLLIDMVFTR
uniref:Nuclear receptor subfamily 0, group B, member 2a n=1 Tax=Cyprinus carpio TaxID=7962 RepID=A0A8C2ICN8_CYPCA